MSIKDLVNNRARLKRQARQAMEKRGHRPGDWVSIGLSKAYCRCLNCGAQVVVTDRPAPNEIEVGGEAVAVNCQVTEGC